jgi:hypothetical protein
MACAAHLSAIALLRLNPGKICHAKLAFSLKIGPMANQPDAWFRAPAMEHSPSAHGVGARIISCRAYHLHLYWFILHPGTKCAARRLRCRPRWRQLRRVEAIVAYKLERLHDTAVAYVCQSRR